MTFRKIDAAAITADLALASPLGRYVADSLREAQQVRLRGCSHAVDARQPMLMCGVPAGDDAELGTSRACLPLLWRKTARATTLTVRVRHNVVVQPVTVGACVIDARTQLRGGVPIPRDEDSATISSTGEVTTELELDVTPHAADQLLVVWLSWRSGAGDSTELLNASDDSALLGWDDRGVTLTAPDHWVDTSTWQTEVAPYAISLVSGASKGSEGDGAYDPDRDPDPFPFGRLALRFDADEDRIDVWPPYGYSNSGANAPDTATEYVRRVELGYSEVLGVELRESAAAALPGYGHAFDALQPTSYLTAQHLYTLGEELFRAHTRVHAVAPQLLPTDLDPDLSDYLNRWTRRRAVGDSATEVASCLVGNGDGYLTAAGASRTRIAYQVDVVVALVALGQTSGAGDLVVSAYCTDLDGSDASAAVTLTLPGVAPNISIPRGGAGTLGGPGDWLGYFGGGHRSGEWRRHVLRGAWPEGLWPGLRLARASLEVLDDDTSERRRLTVQVRWGDEVSIPRSNTVWCEVLAFGVRDATRSTDALIGG